MILSNRKHRLGRNERGFLRAFLRPFVGSGCFFPPDWLFRAFWRPCLAAPVKSRGLLKTNITSVGAAMDEGEAALLGEPYHDDGDTFYDANDEVELEDEDAEHLVVVDAVDDAAAPAGVDDDDDDFGKEGGVSRGEDEEFVRSLLIEDEDNDEVVLTRLKELSDKDVLARTTVDENVVDLELGAKCIAHMEKVAR